MESSKSEVNESSKNKPRTISFNVNGKFEKLRQSCVSFWVHNRQETIFVCTIATDNFVVPWEIEAVERFGNAIVLKLVGEKPNFDAFFCMLKPEREFKSLWDENCNSWLTKSVLNGLIERSQQECTATNR